MNWWLVEIKGFYLPGAVLVEASGREEAGCLAVTTVLAHSQDKGYREDHSAKAVEITLIKRVTNMRVAYIISDGSY